MNAIKPAVLLLCLALVGSCTRHDAYRIARAAASGDPAAAATALARDQAVSYATNPEALVSDIKTFRNMLEKFVKAIQGEWGDKDVRLPQPKTYVKYTQDYLSRATVDFDKGLVTVETLDTKDTRKSLREAIVVTLLTPDDPRAVDLYSAKPVVLGETPFLLGEVKDFDGSDIRWEWRAGRFADRLVSDARTRTIRAKSGKRTATYVTIPMTRDHLNVRAAKYRNHVRTAAKRFNVSPNLIYAIMKVESDFNPFAVSHAMALGLMQVVPTTAGSDVYRFLNGRDGRPTKNMLFQPDTNITYGTAYLHLLDTRFLGRIDNPVSREYCVISGYNGGAGNVLRTFSRDRDKAVSHINSLGPDQVYRTLRADLPQAETRRYLLKVMEAKKSFVNF
ncbi:murein transglycosylase domain-containing protein [Pseudodesulfovibrio tunisiensis]|uniref:murein transglycosylase domain-containing protein n=1 Tax=Pseudodesulfovibrio tunisiensis TaxID=463192 RepID=UPI001FB2FD68|nr:murein transglycosylase domain-containing protein [Pseudodesulfovibrio tunisiensis]